MLPTFCLVMALLGADAPAASSTPGDRAFQAIADDFLAGYFAFRPHTALELGLHEFDGKLSDYSQESLNRERSRLAQFEKRLTELPADSLSRAVQADRQVLLAGLRKAVFEFDSHDIYHRLPTIYPQAVQIDNYLIRDFAPLADRVKSIIAVEKQIPRLLASARANLQPVLGRPIVETSIKVTNGAANFLQDDLPKAIADLQDETLRAELNEANKIAVRELREYAKWLETERLPKADHRFGLGREKYAKMLHDLELVTQPPDAILEFGMKELRREQIGRAHV